MDKVTTIIGFVVGALLAGLIVYTYEQHTIKNLNTAHDTDITNQIAADQVVCNNNKVISEGIDNELQNNIGAINADLAGRVYGGPGTAACVSVDAGSGSGNSTAPGKDVQSATGRSVHRADLDRITHNADKEVAKLKACQSILKAERALQKTP